jgi:hypothetical protein
MAGSEILQRIEELSKERERLVRAEADHGGRHEGPDVGQRLARLDHDLEVLWDLRRREMSGERVTLGEDYADGYTRYTGEDGPGGEPEA